MKRARRPSRLETVVNMNTGTLRDCPVAVDDGEIVSLSARPAVQVVEGACVTLGLIDAHTHIEQSIVTPSTGALGEAMNVYGVLDGEESIRVESPRRLRLSAGLDMTIISGRM